MKAILIMYDSLNRRYLEPYGGEKLGVKTPNFKRLAEKSLCFDRCYAGSLPCMPARRELHTGRYNFLHRGWGPMEPFDDSMPEILKNNNVYTHIITDHYHYWEDGGATYHNRYSSWEGVRGQEGDAWKSMIKPPELPDNVVLDKKDMRYHRKLQDFKNRSYQKLEEQMPMPLTFAKGEAFIRENADADSWFLQLETFDPHEPFFSSQHFLDMYDIHENDEYFDWPSGRVSESDEKIKQARLRSAALHSMCDEYLGKILDLMDEYSMWDDTMLIVCTDHGFMMGEHGWWAKNLQPCYDEIVHTPLFVYDPRTKIQAERRNSLVATIDIAPTLLDFFGLQPTQHMNGVPLKPVIEKDEKIHDGVLFGSFGGQVCVTDGRYVHMRYGKPDGNDNLYEYTLMPTQIIGFIPSSRLQNARLSPPLPFSKGIPLLEIPYEENRLTEMIRKFAPESFQNWLFDLDNDPMQEMPIDDKEIERQMKALMLKLMQENDAPIQQIKRLGLTESILP